MTKSPGHVRQLPNDRWQGIVTHGTRADGRPNQRSKTFDTEDDARKWCVLALHEMGQRKNGTAGVTLSDLWKSYKRVRGPRLAKKTMYNYERMMISTWLGTMGKRDIHSLDMEQVQKQLLTMTHENAKHARRVLSSVLTHGVEIGVLDSNPMGGRRFRMPERDTLGAGFDDDPFAAIESTRDVWGPNEVMECFERIRDLPLETAWLMCTGAGLRVEEALAIRRADVRRASVMGREVTQLAVHAARTWMDGTRTTKTARSVRIATMVEPLGMRLWELVEDMDTQSVVCPVSADRQNARWRNYFDNPPTSKNTPKTKGLVHKGKLHGIPYIPLSRMRATHATLMQEAGVPDSLNAAIHGHSQRVSYSNYQRGRGELAASEAGAYLTNNVQDSEGKS